MIGRYPVGLFAAIAIWIAFLALHATGARDAVSVLSGTPMLDVPFEIAAPVGALYVLLWLAAVVLAPILAIGSGLAWGARLVARRYDYGERREAG